MAFPKPIQQLITAFRMLPGVGPRTAARYTYALLKRGERDLRLFAEALTAVKRETRLCARCFRISERDGNVLCPLCRSRNRERDIVCVVESDTDLEAIEQARVFRGIYHVLGGVVVPLNEEPLPGTRIPQLLARIQKEGIREVILAMNASMEGETTTLYLMEKLQPLGVRMSRLARGLQTGGDLKYLDERTLKEAFDGRK